MNTASKLYNERGELIIRDPELLKPVKKPKRVKVRP